MKKKLISGLLLAAVCGAGAISMTSCKDTEDDLYTELSGNQAALGATLAQLQTLLSQCKTDCAAKISELEQKLAQKYDKDEVDQLLSLYVKKQDIAEVERVIGLLKAAGIDQMTVAELKNLVTLGKIDTDEINQFAVNIVKLNDLVDEIAAGNIDLTALNEAVFGNSQKGIIGLTEYFTLEDGTKISVEDFQTAVSNGVWMNTYKTAIEEMYNSLKKGDDGHIDTDALDALVKYYSQFDEFNAMYNTLFPGVTVDGNGNLVLPEGLEEWWDYAEVINAIIENQKAIEDLKKNVNDLFKRFDDLVTGLVLQATDNPVFGGFNTPFGFNSMVLMTYYGKASSDVNFPLEDSEDAGLKGNVWGALNVAGQNFGGTLYNEELGRLYFTVNPVGANVNADGFRIENSKEVAAPVKLEVIPSDAELRFGFGRSVTNGFYETSVKLDATPADAESKLDQIKIHIEPGLVDALKNVVKNHTMTDVTSLARAVYSNMKDVCTANALRYDWTSTTGGYDENGNALEATTVNNSVLSQYGMAVTAFKPLSFTTLRGTSIDYELPIFGDIQIDKSLVDLDIDWTDIEKVNLQIELDLGEIKFDKVGDTYVTVKVPKKFDIDGDDMTGTLPENWEENPDYYDEITVNIKDQMNEVIDKLQANVDLWIKGNGTETDPGLDKKIKDAIDKAVYEAFNKPGGMIDKINSQVNDMIGSIQNKLDNLVDQINGDKYLGRLNKLIGKYNSLAEKINLRLKNPNQYLQVAMLFENNGGGISILSNSANNYSKFKYNGGEGVSLWATTYNFETLCPVYKKYVAVTKVLVDGQEDNTLLAAANSGKFMNEILDGYTKEVVLATKDVVTAGHTYAFEITYRALDYQGHTSTCRYYMVVDAK